MTGLKKNTMRTTLAVTILVFLSKAGGFIREMITAAYFGTTMENDAYVAAYGLFNIPVLLFNSCITSTLVPLYMEALHNISEKRANRFASNAMNLSALASIVVSIIMYALAYPLTKLVYPGFELEAQNLTAQLTQIMMPGLAFFVVTIVISTVLNARERYMAAQLTGFPLSISLIVAAVVFSGSMGIQAVAFGVVAAGILQIVVLAPFLSKFFKYSFYINLRDKRIHRMLTLAVPAIITMSVNEINHMVDRSLASGLSAGDMSAMNYAFRLVTFVLGVLLVPLTTIMFSKMSERAVDHDKKGIIAIVKQCTEVIALAILPIVVVAITQSSDVIRLAYKRGAFDESSVSRTAIAFAFYMVGVLGFGLRDLFNRAFHSLQDTRTPMAVAMGSVIVNVVLNLILVNVMGMGGLALATSIAGIASAVVLLVILRQRLGRMGVADILEQLLKIGISGVLCALCCVMLGGMLPAAQTAFQSFVRLVVVTGCSLIVYIGSVIVLRVRQVDVLVSMIRPAKKAKGK